MTERTNPPGGEERGVTEVAVTVAAIANTAKIVYDVKKDQGGKKKD